jgi:hypothetical protein
MFSFSTSEIGVNAPAGKGQTRRRLALLLQYLKKSRAKPFGAATVQQACHSRQVAWALLGQFGQLRCRTA